MKRIGIAIAVIIVVFLGLYAVYLVDETPSNHSDNLTVFNVSSEGPYELYNVIQDIKTGSYYEGYDNETVKWMESLGAKKVFVSSDAFVLMDSGDAMKIPSQFATDVYINELFEGNVIEKHSLGNVKHSRDVLLVKDVNYLGEEIHYFEV